MYKDLSLSLLITSECCTRAISCGAEGRPQEVTGGPVTVSTAGPRRLIMLRNYVTESVFLTKICATSFFLFFFLGLRVFYFVLSDSATLRFDRIF